MIAVDSKPARIAIVGAGVAGLTAARLLQRKFDISVFEANDYAGGHSHTVTAEVEGRRFRVDTGFIVCNDRNYPSFMDLLRELRVGLLPAEMSFSVSNPALGLEYNGHNLNTLFAQRGNLWRPSFHRMLLDILRFNRAARQHTGDETVGEFVRRHKFGRLFADNYLLPMVAAIWSCEPGRAKAFPMNMLARFFANHGLLNLFNRPRWFTIAGGSRNYVQALTADFADRIRLSTPVRGVSRGPAGVRLRFDEGSEEFDQVVLACHSDQALALLESPTQAEAEILGAIHYRPNSVLLHHDASLMPRQKRAWASWNFLAGDAASGRLPVVTYCMNILQRLQSPRPLLVSLNAENLVDPDTVLADFSYSHPQYSGQSLRAQARRGEICGVGGIHYCGAWCYDGFHEDAVRSALDVCRRLECAA
ncbi:MAG: FAD-dependent oxidoreductase [Gammaproteobacteria bacterium]|nr:FAD-dependent oxidoreductase [Gammaproteobacteria bacterium]MYH85210.1 FAD-dependent oxidoreductase [Gammaproteobacteria bacterium]MYK04729.1 FAD-dependent oxidoreductase [Gammaproteobacteria bacterium]